MATKTLKTLPKISVRIWRPVIDKLDQKLEAACLRRDAYLNRLLEVELPRLDAEVSMPNSLGAQAFVAASLDQLDRKLVSLTLRPDLVEQLNDICQRKRIVRDAFFNRLFFLLAAKPEHIGVLIFGSTKWKEDLWNEARADRDFWLNALPYPLDPVIDPFWVIRLVLETHAESTDQEDVVDPDTGKTIRVQRDMHGAVAPLDSVYTTFFSNALKATDPTGLNCYVPDWRVPNSEAASKRQALDELAF